MRWRCRVNELMIDRQSLPSVTSSSPSWPIRSGERSAQGGGDEDPLGVFHPSLSAVSVSSVSPSGFAGLPWALGTGRI